MYPVLTLPIKGNILQKFHCELLPRIKVNRNYPTNSIAAPEVFEGLGLKHLQMEQGVEAINLNVFMWDVDHPSQFLLKDILELMQLQSGSGRTMI